MFTEETQNSAMDYDNDSEYNEAMINEYNNNAYVIDPMDGNSLSEYSSLNSNIKKQRQIWKEMKNSDKGYQCITMHKNGKKIPVEFYETKTIPGNLIRNAVTGIREPHMRVGSLDEDLYFKVAYAGGCIGNRNSHTLYYDNPEQWEVHFKITCPQPIKEKWQKKYYKEYKKREKA